LARSASHAADHLMNAHFACPSCGCEQRLLLQPGQAALACGHCRWTRRLQPGEFEASTPAHCLVCGCDDLWRQKDFPQRLGLAAVAAGALLSTVAAYYYRPLLAIGILLAFALFDLVLFALMKDVLVCYRCQARYRNVDPGQEYPRFNLEMAERYRQESARLAQSRPGSPQPPA
jgi:hypothetical protein